MRYLIICVLSFCFFACSGLQKTEYDKIRKKNLTTERITRKHSDKVDFVRDPSIQLKEPYFWESDMAVYLPKITKDFFRCKGHNINAPKEYNKVKLNDCNGSSKHSLPIIHGKESVYPILIDILNHVQNKLHQKVIVTCGHQCPKHSMYSDPTQKNSYHQIGAEVDFYVRGLEDKAFDVIDAIIDYYKNSELYKHNNTYTNFKRTEIDGSQTKAWVNKEICIKYYNKQEKRDHDNRHPYPYISIQVRYDRDLKEKITFSQERAENGFYNW